MRTTTTKTVVGVPSHYSKAEWRALGYDPDRETIGAYLFTPASTRLPRADAFRTIPVSHSCPYCHVCLERLDPRDGEVSGRILAAIVSGDIVRVVLDPVPAGIVVTRCRSCHAVFTIPQRARKKPKKA